MNVIDTRLAEAMSRPLKPGGHQTWADGACVMEAVSYVAGEAWSDHPKCACPVIANFMRGWNDGLPSNEDRDRLLKPLIPRLVGSKSTVEVERRRSWMAFDWLVRVHTPAWLDHAGLHEHATRLRGLGEISGLAPLDDALPVLREARKAAAAAGDAARDASWAAARDASWAAAGYASWAAAWDASGVAARDAAWLAAWNAAKVAAKVAARDALAPVISTLQQSALDLVDRMIGLES